MMCRGVRSLREVPQQLRLISRRLQTRTVIPYEAAFPMHIYPVMPPVAGA
jgi:hypothetical protein